MNYLIKVNIIPKYFTQISPSVPHSLWTFNTRKTSEDLNHGVISKICSGNYGWQLPEQVMTPTNIPHSSPDWTTVQNTLFYTKHKQYFKNLDYYS